MFNIPVTLVVSTPEGPLVLSAGVDIDNIIKVEPISLDKAPQEDIDLYDNCPYVPHTLLHLEDGRCVPIREYPSEINVYLDAYQKLDGFFTSTPIAERSPVSVTKGLRLVHDSDTCDTSAVSTPA